MEKIAICTFDGKPIIGRIEHDEAVEKVNEIIEWIHAHEKDYKSWRSLIRTIAEDEIGSHNKEKHDNQILLDQLAKRVKKLEFYDKMHRKEHSKNDREKA